jgi:T5SS/PEP-CTERM-associated repeat protein
VIAGLLIWIVVDSRPSEAQYTANFQTNIVDGVGSGGSNYIVGSNTFADVLLIRNKGSVNDGSGYVGYEVGSSNNSVVITGSGSVWQNGFFFTDHLYIGYSGAGNSVIISNRGSLYVPSISSMVGANASSSNNSVLVTGSGSVWTNGSGNLTIGGRGDGNSLVISNGGAVIGSSASYCTIGQSSSWNRVTITGTGSTWQVSYALNVGQHEGNSLTVANGGTLYAESGTVGMGFPSGGSNNTGLVTGRGSVWSNLFLHIGWNTGGNSLVISNGGMAVNSGLDTGLGAGDGNQIVVTGTGSVLKVNGTMVVGSGGAFSGLEISDGAQVIDGRATIGSASTSSSNRVVVLPGGSWYGNILQVGGLGSSNSVLVSGGTVSASNLVVGVASPTCDNVVELDTGSVFVTNAAHDAVLEVRDGSLILNGGTIQADPLLMTNPCAQFVHTGGTLIVGNVILDPNAFRIVSVTRQGNDILITWVMGPGATNTLQATTGGPAGGYNTNGFADIFTVTNNTAVGTVTNYLDIGAATNAPARYYRARLVP